MTDKSIIKYCNACLKVIPYGSTHMHKVQNIDMVQEFISLTAIKSLIRERLEKYKQELHDEYGWNAEGKPIANILEGKIQILQSLLTHLEEMEK